MTAQLVETMNKGIDAELDRLTYSAYLLMLDPDLALSVVTTAVEGAQEELYSPSDLLRRTVELSLAQLRRESGVRSDGESSAFEAVLYGETGVADRRRSLSLQAHMSGNPILLLDSDSRIAFVLHHVLGYAIEESAVMAQVSEKGFRARLRKAYLQLASPHLGGGISFANVAGQPALV